MKPRVSILCITYKHVNFIEEALESFLMQETDFEFEIVVGDDASPDDTPQKLKEYQARYPEKIKLLLHETNVGMMNNLVQTYNACSGDYIAFCEGDDFWVDANKLQEQARYLDGNPQCVLCGSETVTFFNGTPPPGQRIRKGSYSKVGRQYSLEDIVLMQRIPTLSIMFRNGIIKEWPEAVMNSPHGDWPINVMLGWFGGSNSTYYHSKVVTGAYRMHDGGVYSMIQKERRLHNTGITALAINSLTNQTYAEYLVPLAAFYLNGHPDKMQILSESRLDLLTNLDAVNYSTLETLSKTNDSVSFKFLLGRVLLWLVLSESRVGKRLSIFNQLLKICRSTSYYPSGFAEKMLPELFNQTKRNKKELLKAIWYPKWLVAFTNYRLRNAKQ